VSKGGALMLGYAAKDAPTSALGHRLTSGRPIGFATFCWKQTYQRGLSSPSGDTSHTRAVVRS
jgi:hypothetical protein